MRFLKLVFDKKLHILREVTPGFVYMYVNKYEELKLIFCIDAKTFGR